MTERDVSMTARAAAYVTAPLQASVTPRQTLELRLTSRARMRAAMAVGLTSMAKMRVTTPGGLKVRLN
jgi:hypothetical protein